MPVILRFRGYRFFFFSNEGDPREPIHVHVRKGERVAKFWVDPEVSLAESYRMNSAELNKLMQVVIKHRQSMRKAWHDYFGE